MNWRVMLMNNPHAIEEVIFDISFSAEDQAFSEQAGLGDFVSKSLLGEVENVFDEYANEHEILRIERLEIDLGVFSSQGYPDEMVERLGVQLRDRLRKLLADYRSDIRVSASGGVGSVTRHEVTLEIFEYFMRHGAFPWHYRAISLEETQKIFSDLIRTQTDAVIRLLYQMDSAADVSIRLMAILSFDDVMMLIKYCLHKRFTSISQLIGIMVDAHLDHGWLLSGRHKGRDACIQALWQILLAVLLHPANRESTLNTLSAALIKKVVRNENISMAAFGLYFADKIDHLSGQLVERNQLRAMLLSLEEQNELANQRVPVVADFLLLLMRCNREELQKWWHNMLAHCHYDVELMVTLKNLFLYTSGRERLIETCSETMLYDWCEYLAPAQIHFIKLCGAVYVKAAETMGQTKQQAIYDFWSQTLLYYGSHEAERFSQKGFLSHLCRGGGHVLSLRLLNALETTIQQQADPHGFRSMIKGMKEGYQRLDIAAVADSEMVVEAVHLSEWIAGCDAVGLSIMNTQWDELLQRHAALLKRLVAIHAPRCLVRRALVNEFSFEQLRDMIGLIDPAAKAFVDDVIRLICRALVASNLVDVSKLPLQGRMLRLSDEHTLWGFTFDFVLVERGSRFNKKAYCSALLREMSAHNNCSYRVLLDVMQQWFSRLSAENSYARDVLSILNDLCESQAIEPLCIATEAIAHPASPVVKGDLDRAFLLKILSQEPPLTDDDAVYLQAMIAGFIKKSGVQDSAYLGGLLVDEVKVRRLISYVSHTQFKHLLSVSGGERYRSLYPHAELLFDGIADDMDSDASAKLRVEWWVFCCRYIYSGPLVSPAVFIKRLADYLLSRSSRDVELAVPQLALFIEKKKSDVLSHVVLDSVKQLFFKEELLAKSNVSADAVEGGSDSRASRNRHELAKKPAVIGDAVYIRNAGLVLLAPYLSTLFERLKLLQHNQFISAHASAHAVHIMQYMADEVGEAPEYMMVLNKLMCGIATAKPVVKDALISDGEKEMINGLLSAVIGNWKGIGNTTVGGLRESFLAREGRLTFKHDQWQLLVESRSYDMLLDSLPWSYAMIKYSWMPHVINVEWR
ncbi:MAG: hypothetical protein L3J89_09730 [Gammaproteobacteria bacterium]|nr:hypothetical protein [Gammaproteobacteria bacterium]